jgi:hypothetical protein
MAEHGKIILHAFSGSSCSWRVRLALSYKGIPYEYKGWNLSKGEHMCEEYKNISPGQTVPALEIDGAVLKDSVAILEFLEERFPDKPLLPRDLVQRAAIRGIVNMISAGIQPIQNLRVLKSIAETGGEQARIEWAQKWITSGFDGNQCDYFFGKICTEDPTPFSRSGAERKTKKQGPQLEHLPTCVNLIRMASIFDLQHASSRFYLTRKF